MVTCLGHRIKTDEFPNGTGCYLRTRSPKTNNWKNWQLCYQCAQKIHPKFYGLRTSCEDEIIRVLRDMAMEFHEAFEKIAQNDFKLNLEFQKDVHFIADFLRRYK